MDEGIRERALGCLLGLAVGDAVGTTLEFCPRDAEPPLTDMVGGGPFGLAAGQWTDDTSMALCVAESLLAKDGFEARDMMERFCRWYREGENSVTGRCFDIGNTVRAAIQRFEVMGDPVAGSDDPMSAGNGSIMRLAPVALLWWRDVEAAGHFAAAQGSLTHRAQEALDACRILALFLVRLIRGDGWDTLWRKCPEEVQTKAIRALAEGTWHGKSRSKIQSTGYVIHTLEAALWSVEQTKSFREAVLLAANLGGDADTVAAVAGQIGGALYGRSGIPLDWLQKLAWWEHIERLGAKLLTHNT